MDYQIGLYLIVISSIVGLIVIVWDKFYRFNQNEDFSKSSLSESNMLSPKKFLEEPRLRADFWDRINRNH